MYQAFWQVLFLSMNEYVLPLFPQGVYSQLGENHIHKKSHKAECSVGLLSTVISLGMIFLYRAKFRTKLMSVHAANSASSILQPDECKDPYSPLFLLYFKFYFISICIQYMMIIFIMENFYMYINTLILFHPLPLPSSLLQD